MRQEALNEFGRLLEIMDELRAKCPWDKKQTFESLRNLTIEETYELADAIIDNDLDEIKKELGDILLHIVFYSKIGSEKESFNISDVLKDINSKIIKRHPHVFGDVKVKDHKEVEDNWEQIKVVKENRTVLGGVPKSLPALIKANRIQQKVSGVGFDWREREDVWNKVKEEIAELQNEITENNNHKTEEEFGDLFFAMVNAARLYDIDPETALERTNLKFIKRFNYIESQAKQLNRPIHDLSLEEMDKFWEEAKRKE